MIFQLSILLFKKLLWFYNIQSENSDDKHLFPSIIDFYCYNTGNELAIYVFVYKESKKRLWSEENKTRGRNISKPLLSASFPAEKGNKFFY